MWPPDEGGWPCLGMKKPRASKSRFDDCEAKASVCARGAADGAVRRAGGYGGVVRFLPAESTLIRGGLPEPLAKRGRGGAHDPGEPTEDGHDAFRRLIAAAEHRLVDHHQHRQNPDQIPRA